MYILGKFSFDFIKGSEFQYALSFSLVLNSMLGTLNTHSNLCGPGILIWQKRKPSFEMYIYLVSHEMNLYLTLTLLILCKADNFKFRSAIGSYLKNDHGVRLGQKILASQELFVTAGSCFDTVYKRLCFLGIWF